jgi:hypothetical protein
MFYPLVFNIRFLCFIIIIYNNCFGITPSSPTNSYCFRNTKQYYFSPLLISLCNLQKSKDAREITVEQVESLIQRSEKYMDEHPEAFKHFFESQVDS